MFATPVQLVQSVAQWPSRSQRAACRNALVASTALAERRRERDDVEEYLAALEAARHRTAGDTTGRAQVAAEVRPA